MVLETVMIHCSPNGTVAIAGSGASVTPTRAEMVSTIDVPVIAMPRQIDRTSTFFLVGSYAGVSDALMVCRPFKP